MTFMYAPAHHWLALCLQGWIPRPDIWLYHHADRSIYMERAG